MKNTPEFKDFLDAVLNILNGKAVDNLETQIKASLNAAESRRELSDLYPIFNCARKENRVLHGETPDAVYGSDYRILQNKSQQILTGLSCLVGISLKYKHR